MVAGSTWRAPGCFRLGLGHGCSCLEASTWAPCPRRRLQSVFNLTLQVFNGRRVFMILNYYCFEINGRLSHVRPCMICGGSRTVTRPSPPHALGGRAQHPASAGLGTTRVTSRPRNKPAPADFFFFFF